MFETLKIYLRKNISLETVTQKLIELGYTRQQGVNEEGDYSLRGDTLEIFPVNFSFPARIEWELETVTKIYSFDKTHNKKIIDYDFLILLPFHKRPRRYSEDFPLDALLRIKKGDYVVHSHYGIGKFLGLKKMPVKGGRDEFFAIEYAKKDILYVAREEAHFIQKYTSFSLRSPKLTHLSSREWLKTKQRVEQGIKNFALELLSNHAHRALSGKQPYPPDTSWQQSFEAKFPYRETEDQTRTVKDTKADMESSACMDRLVCGDVGYGKTEVAMRAAFKAVMGGRQVAFLVPTTILAYQHYVSLRERLVDFPVQVEMLSRFRTPAEQATIIKRIADGKVDIIVGTHRLLSDDVRFHDLGLLVVDEEQRFGVRHKERMKRLKSGIDVLTLTATPIPRTLYMSLIDIKKISIIKTPPQDRKAVKTRVIEFNTQTLCAAINDELSRGGQVFFIHNRIETIANIAKKIKKILPPTVRFGMVHGRLSSREIERVMFDFISGNIDCLISTAIVESGIDIPAANTIIINDAHQFGLSDLHQLRGRVGRFNIQAYAYLVIPRHVSLRSDVSRRLRLVEEFSHLGSGFDIAMSDLELRGAGNIMGVQQHGFVWMIGFDLYCRLLKKEIEYLKSIGASIFPEDKT